MRCPGRGTTLIVSANALSLRMICEPQLTSLCHFEFRTSVAGGRKEAQCVLCDHQLFVGWYDIDRNAAVLARYQRLSRGIGVRIKRDSKPGKLPGDTFAHCRRVLADPGRENKAIKSAKRGSQHAGKQP